MADPRFDILGIGNAIVDVIAHADDAFLDRHKMHKGSMALIDAVTAERIYASMPLTQEASGGSAANTCAVAAMLGAKTAYIGKISDDPLGRVFAHDIRASGVEFDSIPLLGSSPTARCLILVSPDGQRTMNTFLGACIALDETDVDPLRIREAAVTYLEGYLFDPPAAQTAFRKAAAAARSAGRKVALSLSDPFCVDRHRTAFRVLVREDVDILFANEAEISSLYETEFDQAVNLARQDVTVAALTRSEKGSVIVAGSDTVMIEAVPTQVVDTTGAGDAYAAGFLTGWTRGASLTFCGNLGSEAAAVTIARIGARPDRETLISAIEKLV